MATPMDLRTIVLWERDWIPLWNALGGLSAEDLRLSSDVRTHLGEWEEAIWAAPVDEADMSTEGYRLLSTELRRAGGSIAQLIADEMGEGISVLFESHTFSSRCPPTNPRARAEYDAIVEEYERALRRSQNARRKARR